MFRKHLNISPQEYLANYRITRAEQLLNTTTLSIETISNSCGYQDPLVFAKAFKAKKVLHLHNIAKVFLLKYLLINL